MFHTSNSIAVHVLQIPTDQNGKTVIVSASLVMPDGRVINDVCSVSPRSPFEKEDTLESAKNKVINAVKQKAEPYIKNNQNIYLPYFMAASLIVMLFYSLRSVSFMVANSTAAGGVTMSAMLQLSSWICGILSLVILFYVNSFIMKRRKKEFGLYSILGMENAISRW